MPISLLHLSDLHLDAAFPALGPARRADLRAALGRILALARERGVDVVTLAGDLFEQDYALPDTAAFLARLANGTTLVLEIKGQETEQDRAKHAAAKRWIAAVNNWGNLGRWAFQVCHNPQTLERELSQSVRE